VNLALPAFLIILGLLPGIVFFHGYFSGRFSKQLAGVGGVTEVALYVSFALPLDVIGVIVFRRFGAEPEFALMARLVSSAEPAQTADHLAVLLKSHWVMTNASYLGLLGGSGVAGILVRRFVWAFRLDVVIPLLRMKQDWYYLLQGRLASLPRTIFPYADILVEHPDGSELYQGLVLSFEVGGDGGIRQLVLRDAHRGKGRGQGFYWRPIPGNTFIVMGSCIRSINMRYIVVHPVGAESLRLRIWHWIRDFYRSFVFQEP